MCVAATCPQAGLCTLCIMSHLLMALWNDCPRLCSRSMADLSCPKRALLVTALWDQALDSRQSCAQGFLYSHRHLRLLCPLMDCVTCAGP